MEAYWALANCVPGGCLPRIGEDPFIQEEQAKFFLDVSHQSRRESSWSRGARSSFQSSGRSFAQQFAFWKRDLFQGPRIFHRVGARRRTTSGLRSRRLSSGVIVGERRERKGLGINEIVRSTRIGSTNGRVFKQTLFHPLGSSIPHRRMALPNRPPP